MAFAQKLAEVARAHGADKSYEFYKESIAQRKAAESEFSIRELAESLMGPAWASKLNQFRKGGRLLEAGEATDASQFSAITGQLYVDRVKEKYKLAKMITDQIFDVEQVTNGNLGTQKIPYLSNVIDDPSIVSQGMPYPQSTFSAQYITAPAPEKFGFICALTMETIYSDLTGQMMNSADSVGERTGLFEEYKKLKVFLGVVNNHSWNGTSYNTYQTTTPWINKVTGFTLSDWTSINTLEQLFYQMTDPVTGKPIMIEPKDLFVMPTKKYLAKRIVNATEVAGGDITTGAGVQTWAANPLDRNYKLLTSPHARKVAVDASISSPDEYILLGDFKKAFAWRQVLPVQVVQAPPMNEKEFNQDIVFQVKANGFGVAYTKDPRYAVLATA